MMGPVGDVDIQTGKAGSSDGIGDDVGAGVQLKKKLSSPKAGAKESIAKLPLQQGHTLCV